MTVYELCGVICECAFDTSKSLNHNAEVVSHGDEGFDIGYPSFAPGHARECLVICDSTRIIGQSSELLRKCELLGKASRAR